MKLARDLRKSGSDIIVEADLAEVFGRARISSELEAKFKDRTKITTIAPLWRDSDIILHSGPGPTVQTAFRDQGYFASVVQLSFLSWVHQREALASMLSIAMAKRFEASINGASPDPGHEEIMKTLMAISSQTSSFNWSPYVQLVEARLKAVLPNYSYSPDYTTLSPSLLLGAMDYLFIVQRLPEDRKISVSNENGAITLTVWAHYILNQTVAIIVNLTNGKTEKLLFGAGAPHVTIEWVKETKEGANEMFWPCETEDEDATIRLLDSNMVIVLETAPESDPDRRVFRRTQDRHPLKDYGSAYLRRVYNEGQLVPEGDPVYEESVKLATALALHANSRLDRGLGKDSGQPEHQSENPYPSHVEAWRILDAAKLIFASLGIAIVGVNSYTKLLAETTLDEDSCPNTFKAFLKRVHQGRSSISKEQRLLDQITHLAKVVL